MKLYFFFFAFIIHTSCFAEKVDSVKNYYFFKNKGEMCIVDSNYADGLVNYKKAFSYKSPNVLDVYNALVLAYQLKDSVSAESFFNHMAYHGLNKEVFETKRLGLFAKEESFYKWLTRSYDSSYRAGANTNMVQYAKIIDSLSEADQSVRKSYKLNEQGVNALVLTDNSNLLFLKTYIKQNGFPSYDRIGNFEKSIEGNFYSPNSLFFILWHTRHTSQLLNKTLLDAVIQGDYNPDEYALLIDLQRENSIYYNALPRKFSKAGKVVFLPVPNLNTVNKKRASIYLDNVENYKRKLLFSENNKPTTLFVLIPFWNMATNFGPVDMRSWKKMTK
jgi:hypothetical protein